MRELLHFAGFAHARKSAFAQKAQSRELLAATALTGCCYQQCLQSEDLASTCPCPVAAERSNFGELDLGMLTMSMSTLRLLHNGRWPRLICRLCHPAATDVLRRRRPRFFCPVRCGVSCCLEKLQRRSRSCNTSLHTSVARHLTSNDAEHAIPLDLR
jgi:hypothetical protein